MTRQLGLIGAESAAAASRFSLGVGEAELRHSFGYNPRYGVPVVDVRFATPVRVEGTGRVSLPVQGARVSITDGAGRLLQSHSMNLAALARQSIVDIGQPRYNDDGTISWGLKIHPAHRPGREVRLQLEVDVALPDGSTRTLVSPREAVRFPPARTEPSAELGRRAPAAQSRSRDSFEVRSHGQAPRQATILQPIDPSALESADDVRAQSPDVLRALRFDGGAEATRIAAMDWLEVASHWSDAASRAVRDVAAAAVRAGIPLERVVMALDSGRRHREHFDTSAPGSDARLWQAHAEAVANALRALPADRLHEGRKLRDDGTLTTGWHLAEPLKSALAELDRGTPVR